MTLSTLDLIPVDKLIPDPQNPRESYPKAGITELAKSIVQVGQLEAIGVAPVAGGNDTYDVKFGHRRHLAIALINEDPKAVGYDGPLPFLARCEVGVAVNDVEKLLQQIVENDQREDLNPIEQARAYKRAIEEGGITMSAFADKIGKNKGFVSKRLSLLDLPDQIHKLVLDGSIKIEAAVEMAKLDEPLTDLAELIGEIKDGYNATTEEIVDTVRGALDIQTKRRAMVSFADAIKAKGHEVVSFMTARENVEKGHVVTTGNEVTPAKIPAKLPAHAVGIEILGPERGRILLSAPASEAAPASVEVSEEDRKAAAAGDVSAQEKLAAKEKAEKQAKRNLLARVREEQVHRLGYLTTVVDKSNATDVGKLALRFVVEDGITDQNRQRVCEMLGLDPVIEVEKITEWKGGKQVDTGKTRNVKRWDKALAAYLTEQGEKGGYVKAAMACLVTKGEAVLPERSPGFELSTWREFGYANHLAKFPFEELAEQPAADLTLDLDGPTDDEVAAQRAKKATAKKAPAAKKAAPAKKAAAKRL